MLEMLYNPKYSEKGPIKMLFIGLVYASLSLILVHYFFSGDIVQVKYSGWLVVLFCVVFSLPFMYFLIKQETDEDEDVEGFWGVMRAHSDALYAFMWLFLGFIIAFAFWFIVLQDFSLLNAQIETYCAINSPGSVETCVQNYDFTGNVVGTGDMTNSARFLAILQNNVYVMIFTLVFSLLFGAGAMIILVWNASVIGAAIAMFSKYNISEIPIGVFRYMIHGFPEIAAYFVTALAGGVFGSEIIKNGLKNKKIIRVLENSVIMLFIALIILVVAAIIEVYITPSFF